MKKIYLFLILSIFSCNIFALNEFVADYKLYVDNIKVATETRKLNFYGDKYEYISNANATGIAKLFGDISIEAKSIFTLNDAGINSEKYSIKETKDGELTRSYIIDIYPSDKKIISGVTSTNPNLTTFKTEGGNILDPLSLFIALSNDLKNQPNKIIFSYQVADGKYLKSNEYKKMTNQTLMINGNEEHVIRVKEFNSEGNMSAFFSPKHLYLPVIMEQNKNGHNHRYEITGLKFKEENSEELQIIF
jgi:hypothetical protein